MKKQDDRMELRLPGEEKKELRFLAEQNGQTNSKYVRGLIHYAYLLTTSHPESTHEQVVSSYVLINRLQYLMVDYPQLPSELKKKIIEEIANYVSN